MCQRLQTLCWSSEKDRRWVESFTQSIKVKVNMFRNRVGKIKQKTTTWRFIQPASSQCLLFKSWTAEARNGSSLSEEAPCSSWPYNHVGPGVGCVIMQARQLTSPVLKRKPSSYLVKLLYALLSFWSKGDIKWRCQEPLFFISLLNSRELQV